MRDLANAHVLAAEKEAAGGERMIVASGCYWWQDFGAFICFCALNLHAFFRLSTLSSFAYIPLLWVSSFFFTFFTTIRRADVNTYIQSTSPMP